MALLRCVVGPFLCALKAFFTQRFQLFLAQPLDADVSVGGKAGAYEFVELGLDCGGISILTVLD